MSLPAYQVYQETGQGWIGRIPQHWRLLPLFALANERRAKNTGMAEDNLLSLSFGRIVRKDISTSEGLLPESFETYQIVEKDDIVWRLTDLQNDKRSLRTAIVRERGIITSAYLATQPTGLDPDFLNYLLRAYDLTKVFYSLGSGLRQSMKWADVKWLPIVTPTKDEQRGIVSFLDRETAKIDALIEEQEKLISLLQEKRQAVISHAVTKGLDPTAPMKPSGIDWLGDIPAHWELVPTNYRYSIQLGRMLNQERAEGEHLRPYLRVADVQWHSINSAELPQMDFPPNSQIRYRLERGDLLVNEGGSYVGRSAIWEAPIEECYYQKALHRLRAINTTKDTTRFFVYVMEMATKRGLFVATGNQTTIDHLTAEKLGRHRFAFPPLEEQVEIARCLDERLSMLLALETESIQLSALLKERRAALISAAVTGKIDVRGLAAQSEKQAEEVAA